MEYQGPCKKKHKLSVAPIHFDKKEAFKKIGIDLVADEYIPQSCAFLTTKEGKYIYLTNIEKVAMQGYLVKIKAFGEGE